MMYDGLQFDGCSSNISDFGQETLKDTKTHTHTHWQGYNSDGEMLDYFIRFPFN